MSSLHSGYIPVPERAACLRCVKSFTYTRRTKRRLYCDACQILQRQDANDFTNNRARQRRLAARMNAWMAHA